MTDTDFPNQFNREEDFVEDINDQEDEVERQIDQTIAAYNQNKDHYGIALEGLKKQSDFSRNRVTSANPNWGNRRDIQTNQDQQTGGEDHQESEFAENLGSTKRSFYDRFAAYVAQNHMSPEDIFTLDKDKYTSDEFKEMLDIAGFEYTHEELEDTLFDITNAHFMVLISTFKKKIKTWQKHLNKEKALEALKDNTIKMAQNSRKKLSKVESTPKSFIVRPQSSLFTPQGAQGGKTNKSNRPFSGISNISSAKSKHTFGNTQNDFKTTETDGFQRSNYENKSALYLQESKKREAQNEKLLKMTLDKAQSELELDCMEKMSEANEYVQSLGQPITYKPYTSEDGSLRCHIYEYDRLIAELTMKEFLREYRNLKNRNNSNQRVPIWETLTKQKSSGANFYFSSAKTLQNEPSEELEAHDARRGVKKDRQKELKTVLFETMKLSDILQGQLEKLKRAGLGAQNQAPKHE